MKERGTDYYDFQDDEGINLNYKNKIKNEINTKT